MFSKSVKYFVFVSDMVQFIIFCLVRIEKYAFDKEHIEHKESL
jgi:hypothetical protein